ncbi:MAG TPA: 4-hydroxyphenylacetate 3-monooxygenase, oxygenase component [Trebonia sp.]|nr:4-hydroxyphenylacetate 3-monooxygenase, oxygenase component [Trebonia sp.]
MGARTGRDYLERLDASRPDVIVDGQRVSGGIPAHPAFRNVTASYAQLYDMQHDPALRDVLTYQSPTTGDRVGASFLVPKTATDLEWRRDAMSTWARFSGGMLGRTGDYLNSALMALSQAQDWFAQADPAFAANIGAYYELVREQDLLLTHTLIPPQVNRSVSGSQQGGGALMARIVAQDDNGITVRGARMLATIGPIADELLVFPSTVLRATTDDAPYAFAFAIPCDTPGLRFICRQPLDHTPEAGRTHWDAPLSSRFEEMDAVVVFDDVRVPNERIFMLGHPELCNAFYSATDAVVHMTHQVVCRTTAKSEFFLGLVSLLTEAIGIEQFGHVLEDIAEIVMALETARAMMRAAEADATLNSYGVLTPAWGSLNACRNWYPKASQRFPAIVRKLGASGLMALPTEADLAGEAAADIAMYLQAKNLNATDRVRLFRLAWDAALSDFAGRQALYEYYFFGDPVRMAEALVRGYDRDPYKERVRQFLKRED